jgi:hypothetical protein
MRPAAQDVTTAVAMRRSLEPKRKVRVSRKLRRSRIVMVVESIFEMLVGEEGREVVVFSSSVWY